jgi:hypothetical protein
MYIVTAAATQHDQRFQQGRTRYLQQHYLSRHGKQQQQLKAAGHSTIRDFSYGQ